MNPEAMTTFKPYEGDEPFIFVSYSHRDSALVFPIIQRLHENGLRVWYDRGIDPGSEWPEEIATHLLGCGLFLLFMSPDAAESHNVRREITMAIDRKKPLLTVYLKDTELQPGLQLQLNLIQYVSYNSGSGDESFEDFIERLTGILLKKAPEINSDVVKPPVFTPPGVSAPPRTAPPPAVDAPPKQVEALSWLKFKHIFIFAVIVIIVTVGLIVLLGGNGDEPEPGSPELPGEAASDGEALTESAPADNEVELDSAILGDSFHVVLAGSQRLEFTNTFAANINMPTLTSRVRVDYVLFDRDGAVTDYRTNVTSFGNNIESGSRIAISLTNPAESTQLVLPAELANDYIIVKAFDAPALEFVTLTGANAIEFTNNSDIERNPPKATSSTRWDYVVFDKDGRATHFNANSTTREALAPGSKKALSPHNPSNTIVFFYPTEWKGSVITVRELDKPAVHYVDLSGTDTVRVTNISANSIGVPKALGNARRDYAIYDAEGNETESRTNATNHGSTLEPGHVLRVSLTNSANSLRLYFPSELLDTVFAIATE
jgi:hypothetical protein